MSRFLFAAFAIVVFFSVATADTCPPNEVYKECGTACPPKCTDPNPQNCTLQCIAGCVCRDHLVRNSENECIRLKDCDSNN